MKMKNKNPSLVVLDRDGVINKDSSSYIKSVEEWLPIKSSITAIKKLHEYNIPLAIATNQSGLSKGLFDKKDMNEIHKCLKKSLGNNKTVIKYIAICKHSCKDNCFCRKPKIGLLKKISKKLNIKLDKKVFFVGDSYKDFRAAKKANCTSVIVKTGKGKKTIKKHHKELTNNLIFKDLYSFVEWLL